MCWRRNKLRPILLQPCHSPSGKQKPHPKSKPGESVDPTLRADPEFLRASNTAQHFCELLIPPWSAMERNPIFPPLCRTHRAVTGYQPPPEQPDLGKPELNLLHLLGRPWEEFVHSKRWGQTWAENYMLWETWFMRLKLRERLPHLWHENSSYQMIAWSLWSVCGSIPAFVPFSATEPSRVISTGRSLSVMSGPRHSWALLVVLWLDFNL